MIYILKLVDQGIFNRYVEEHDLHPQIYHQSQYSTAGHLINYVQNPSSYEVMAPKAPKAQKYNVAGAIFYYVNQELT